MGNIPGSFTEFTESVALLRQELLKMRIEMSSFQKRLAGLEKDVSKCGLAIRECRQTTDDNSNSLLNISLLEEGRSVYRPKRHAASSYA